MRVPHVPIGIGLCLLAAALTACSSSRSGPDVLRGVEAAERYTADGQGRRIGPAMGPAPVSIDGEAVGWEALVPRMAEAAGGMVVEEVALERALEAELARRGLSVTGQDLANERSWLGLSVVRGAGQTGAAEDELVQEIRQRRGLGPERFAALLRRNAMLRAMVRGRVEVTDSQVALAWRVQHGERLRTRIIVTPTEREAQSLATQAFAGGSPGVGQRFAELAQMHSTDSSAARGGLIEPFSPDDPAYEQSVRAAAASLQPGQIGPVVAIANGFALVYLDERLPPDGVPLESVRAELTEQLRRRQERLLMDELATQLLAETRVRVLDESLDWSVRAGQQR